MVNHAMNDSRAFSVAGKMHGAIAVQSYFVHGGQDGELSYARAVRAVCCGGEHGSLDELCGLLDLRQCDAVYVGAYGFVFDPVRVQQFVCVVHVRVWRVLRPCDCVSGDLASCAVYALG